MGRAIKESSNGAVCVTDGSLFWEENYTDMRELVLFDYDNLEMLPQKLLYLMYNDEVAANIAKNGYEAAYDQT